MSDKQKKYCLVLIEHDDIPVPSVCFPKHQENGYESLMTLEKARESKKYLEATHESAVYLIAEINYLPAEEQ